MTQRGPATLGEFLYTYRSQAGLTQQELARRAGLSVRAVRNIERGGIGQPRQESVRRLAAGLGLSDTERDQFAAYADEERLPTLLRVELLGPLAAWRGDIRVDRGGGLRRRLLGALALRPGHVVSRDELIDLLWDEHPPRTAASSLHVCVGQLRAMLEPGRAPREAPEIVVRVHDGYRLDLGDEQVDLTRFDHGLALARGLRGTAALDQYDQALGLWRGLVLADCGDQLRTHPAAVAAAGRRIAAVCAAADLAVAEGQPARAVPWLRGTLAEEPLHEGLHARLILALSASGGRAEALGHYTRARRTLIDELGVEPGPELRAAHGAALGQDRTDPAATAATAVPEPGAAAADRAPPAQLPPALHSVTGRGDQLRQLEFGLLGPVEVRIAGQVTDAGHPRQRAVLAVLLLDLGRVVTTEALIDRVWGEAPPASVRNVLYGSVAGLRAAIADAADPEVTLVRHAGGYLLQAGTEQVDLHRFRHLVTEAAEAAGDDQRSGALLRQALGLWRGPALAGLDSPWLRGMRDALEQERAAAVLNVNDIRLRQGQHAALIGELAGQAAASPADERLIGQLMLALYRSGRQAEALRWYEQTRRHLAGEFGTDPGPQLQALHQQILRADPLLTAQGSASLHPVPVPRQLPSDVSAFTGRAAELAEMDRLLTSLPDGKEAAMAVIFTVSGTAGVGKTALAVHWAHQAAKQFSDGQLYVNLRGYDPGQPMTATDALAGFLRALGVPGQDMPPEEGERAARYRSLLAGRRMLVVLDNADDVEQVRPLLPGSPACVALVTSRDSLAGLVARDGARRMDLDLLSQKDAIGLLRALIGARVDADPEAAAALAAQCSRLPLALRVAAELAAARPAMPLTDLAGELSDQQQRLDMLEVNGDPRTAVRAVFSWSYQHLGRDAARLFRLAGLHPGPDLDPYAAAALTSSAVSQVRKLLDQLTRVHLLQPAGPDRYGMHDLLRAYAAEQAAQDAEEERQAALTRLFDYYLHTAATAMDTMFPSERHRRPRVALSTAPAPAVTDRVRAQTWLDEQRAALVIVAAYTADHGWPGHATRLAVTLFRYLDSAGYYPEAITIHTCAQYAARRAGYRAAEANVLTNLGTINARMGHYRQATDHHQQALALFRELGDQGGEARALHNLGTVDLVQVRPQQADGYFQQALPRYRQAGDRTGEARTLNNLGVVDGLQGRYQQAAEHHQQALALCKEIGDRVCEGQALTNLGSAYLEMGRYYLASDFQRQALALAREIGDRTCQAHSLVNLGHINVRQTRYRQAAECHEQALDLFRKIGDRSGEAEALNGLGDIFLAASRPGNAHTQHTTALSLASQVGDRVQQARAHSGLARAYFATGDPGRARHHWQEALTRYTELGAPEADQVRAELATAGHQRHLEP